MYSFLKTPGKYTWEICENCEGHNTVNHPAFSNGFTQSEWAEEDDDFKESYLKGDYDVKCPDCEGGKVRIPNMQNLSFTDKREMVQQRQSLDYDAMNAAERRMGA